MDDELNYQVRKETNTVDSYDNELLTVKFRYKRPDEKKSRLIVETLKATQNTKSTSDNFRFSAAVAQFGMILRNSEYKGDSNHESVIKLAKGALGEEEYGYKKEFINLVESCSELANQ